MHTSDDRDTSRQLRAAEPIDSVPPLSDDVHEALGQLMTEVHRGIRRTEQMTHEFATLSREVGALSRLTEDHRKATDAAATKAGHTAAKSASNRLAVAFGAIVTLYEVAQPLLHELAKVFH